MSDWYTDKDLFEMIQGLKQDLNETLITIKKYNGLWEKFDNVDHRLTAIEQQAVGRSTVGRSIREWGGWIVAIISLLMSIYLKGSGV